MRNERFIVEHLGWVFAQLVPADTLAALCDCLAGAEDSQPDSGLGDFDVELADRLLREIVIHRNEVLPENRRLIS